MNQASQLLVDQIPELLHLLEVSLRSGYSVSQSFEIVVKDMNGPITADVQKVLTDVQGGSSWLAALDGWFFRSPSLELDLFVAAMHEQLESGGNLANKLQFLAQLLPNLKRVGWQP